MIFDIYIYIYNIYWTQELEFAGSPDAIPNLPMIHGSRSCSRAGGAQTSSSSEL